MNPVSIIIPSYSGKELLAKFLPSVIAACQYYGGQSEIIVVDNGSVDGTEEFLRSHFPYIKVICSKINLGFSRACNLGVEKSQYGIVIFLNSDVKVKKDFIPPVMPHFDNEQVFAVRLGVKTSEADDHDASKFLSLGEFKFGLIYTPEKMSPKEKSGSNFLFAFKATGGFSAVRKSKFIKLGGFDELFSPFYSEDTDISYRAWKQGWQIIYEPKSIIYHIPGTTIFRLFPLSYIDRISERNKFILVWKNITDKRLILQHLFFIPIRLIKSICELKFTTFYALVSVLKLLPKIWLKRKMERRLAVLTDRQVFAIFKPHINFPDYKPEK